MKYRRASNQFRSVASRLNDWNEVYNHKGIMKGITKQAARYVSLSHICLWRQDLTTGMKCTITRES